MADLLSTALTSSTSSTSSTSEMTQSEKLVESYKQTQQSKVDAITDKITELESRQTFYNNLNTKINTLVSAIDTFTASNANSKFVTRKVSVSDDDILTATADSNSITGYTTVNVNRLASSDTLISKQLDRTADSGLTGTYSFKINAADADLDEETITVNFGSTPLTNEEAMKAIANAINARDDLDISASYIKDTPNTGRLTFISSDTGEENSIVFDDNGTGILSNFLGFSNITDRVSSDTDDTAARYNLVDKTQLNSEIVLNGVTVTHASNEVDDVMPGIKLNLKKVNAGETPVTLSNKVDTSAVETLITPLLKAYNDLLDFIKSDYSVYKNEAGVSNLYNTLRGLSSQAMTSGADSKGNTIPKYLTEIGIKISSTGTLSVGDYDTLEDVLTSDGGGLKVAALFTTAKDSTNSASAYGVAERLYDSIKSFTGYTDENGNSVQGIIKSRKYSLSTQIDSQEDRKTELETRIEKQAQALRKEYENMLQVYLEAQTQYSSLLNTSSYSSS